MKLPKVPKYFSRQAQVAMLGYVVLAVAILLPVNLEKEEYNLTERVVSLLMMLLPMVVSIYTINCLVKGSSKGGLPCDVLAWLNSGSILVWSILVLVLTLLIYANNDVEGFRRYSVKHSHPFGSHRFMFRHPDHDHTPPKQPPQRPKPLPKPTGPQPRPPQRPPTRPPQRPRPKPKPTGPQPQRRPRSPHEYRRRLMQRGRR